MSGLVDRLREEAGRIESIRSKRRYAGEPRGALLLTDAANELERLERDLGALRFAGIQLYKWLLTVPNMEPPLARFSIPDELWEPYQDALFDTTQAQREGGC